MSEDQDHSRPEAGQIRKWSGTGVEFYVQWADSKQVVTYNLDGTNRTSWNRDIVQNCSYFARMAEGPITYDQKLKASGHISIKLSFDIVLNQGVDSGEFAERIFNLLCGESEDELPEIHSVDGYDLEVKG